MRPVQRGISADGRFREMVQVSFQRNGSAADQTRNDFVAPGGSHIVRADHSKRGCSRNGEGGVVAAIKAALPG